MQPNKIEHSLIGMSIASVGVLGLSLDWIGPAGKPLFILIAASGFLWAWVVGHVWQILWFVIDLPMLTAGNLF